MAVEVAEIVKRIVNVFETGEPVGNYGLAVILDDGAGISYGRSQATDKGGNLDLIVYRYLDAGGVYADELRPYLDELDANGSATVDPANPPRWCRDLMDILRKAGAEDPIMRTVQDRVFDERYFAPAVGHARSMQIELPLSLAVVYDSCVHSGPDGVPRIRRLFGEVPPSRGGDEKAWTRAYVAAREAWLGSHPRAAVRKTTYRMRAFRTLIADDNWSLALPLSVLSRVIA